MPHSRSSGRLRRTLSLPGTATRADAHRLRVSARRHAIAAHSPSSLSARENGLATLAERGNGFAMILRAVREHLIGNRSVEDFMRKLLERQVGRDLRPLDRLERAGRQTLRQLLNRRIEL